MTTATPSSGEEPAAPALPRGARARRALILRRAANRTAARRLLRSLGGEARRPSASAPALPAPEFEVPVPDDAPRPPSGRPVEPDVALEGERNRWGGRL